MVIKPYIFFSMIFLMSSVFGQRTERWGSVYNKTESLAANHVKSASHRSCWLIKKDTTDCYLKRVEEYDRNGWLIHQYYFEDGDTSATYTYTPVSDWTYSRLEVKYDTSDVIKISTFRVDDGDTIYFGHFPPIKMCYGYCDQLMHENGLVKEGVYFTPKRGFLSDLRNDNKMKPYKIEFVEYTYYDE